MERLYYYDILKKIVQHKNGVAHNELCCLRLDYDTFLKVIRWLIDNEYIVEIQDNNNILYQSTDKGVIHMNDLCMRQQQKRSITTNSNNILELQKKLNSCWINVNQLLPEDAEGLEFTNSYPNLKFVTVIVKDNEGHVGIRNRLLHSKCGNEYLDASIRQEGWHWSNGEWEPTHWMPFPK